MSFWYRDIYPENQYFYNQERYYYNYEGEKYCNCHNKSPNSKNTAQKQLKSSQWYCCKEEDLKKYSDYHFQTPCGTYYKIKPMKYTANREAGTQCNFPLFNLNISSQSHEKRKTKNKNKQLKRNKTCPQFGNSSVSFLITSNSKNDRLRVEKTHNAACDCHLVSAEGSNILKAKSSSQNEISKEIKSRPVSARLISQNLDGKSKESKECSTISNTIISRGSSRLDYSSGSLYYEDNGIEMLKPPDVGQISRSTITEIHSEELDMEGKDCECAKTKSCHLLERIRRAYKNRYRKG